MIAFFETWTGEIDRPSTLS